MTTEPSQADAWIQSFLDGLIECDEEEKKPENIDPYFRNMEGAGGIHFWQLQQFIEELADILRNIDEDLDEVEARWKDHELFWGRYLSTGAIEYARRWNAANEKGEDFDDCEFSMDWFGSVKPDPSSESKQEV
tara:strand:- start:400 stop:798 length:399 start_codon:yes stop_codon:yes gene_type:complete